MDTKDRPAPRVRGRNLHQRINAVRAAVGYIKRTAVVDGRYTAVRHDEVTRALRPALIEHGIIVLPSLVQGATVSDTGLVTKAKQPIIRYEGVFAVTLANADEPADREVIQVPAHALDSGDKAPGKALSYAVKAALLKVFTIETGEDDEVRVENEHQPGGLTQQQIEALEEAIDGLESGDGLLDRARKAWDDVKAACEAANDRQTLLRLRARLSSRVHLLKKGGENMKGVENV